MQPFRSIARWIFWDFGRNAIPYEIVCAVYIALLVFVPASSSGWFNEGERVNLTDGSEISLHRDGIRIMLSWPEETAAPDLTLLENFARARFGEGTTLRATVSRITTLQIIPGGMSWPRSQFWR